MIPRSTLALVVLTLALTACAPKTAPTESIPSTTTPFEAQLIPTNTTVPSPTSTARPTPVVNAPVGCQTYSLFGTPTTEDISRFPDSLEGDWTRGPEDAAVTIIEYSDFQCPSCAALEPMLQQLQAVYPDQIRVIYRHFPLVGFPEQPIHDKAILSTQAAEAAGRQGKFWEMHDLLFSEQKTWSGLQVEEFEDWVIEQAGELGLDVQQFSEDLTSPELVKLAEDAWTMGVANNLMGTPSLVVNGRLMDSVPLTYSNLDILVRLMLLEKRQYATCPLITIDQSRRYEATLHTSIGDVVIELFADRTPLTVNNFIFLAEEGWYDRVTFHRVLPGYMAQAGDPTGTGLGGPGYTFINEIVGDLKFDRAGRLAMANSGPDTNGSQFFITYGPAPDLNGDYTIFGQVTSGMEVLEQLTPRNPEAGMNLPPGDLIIHVTIEEK